MQHISQQWQVILVSGMQVLFANQFLASES